LELNEVVEKCFDAVSGYSSLHKDRRIYDPRPSGYVLNVSKEEVECFRSFSDIQVAVTSSKSSLQRY
jgi:hypothetical protein